MKNEGDLGFIHRIAKNGTISINRNGNVAATLRGSKAAAFIEKMNRLNFSQQQQLMARITGNYKRGNEKLSKNHPRNK